MLGILNEDLKLFLETNVPTGKKAKKEGGIELGVMDTRITATIQEQLGIQCATGDAVSEVLRGRYSYAVYFIYLFYF